MKEELEQLNKKLDGLTVDLKEIKSLLLRVVIPSSTPIKTYKVPEAAAYLRLSMARVYELVYTGKLLPTQRKKYSRLLFTTEQLNQYLYANQATPTAATSSAHLPVR